MPDVFDMDPERLSDLLHQEASGQLPEAWKPIVEKYRAKGMLPPPRPGGSQLWGGTTAAGKPTSGYKPAIPPVPTMTRLQSAVAEIPGAIDTAKSIGTSIKDTVLDPESLGATAGGIAGGALTDTPYGAMAGAGLGSGLVAAGREAYNAPREGRVMRPGAVGSAVLSGAAGEAAGRAIPWAFKSQITPIGANTAALLGDKAMIPDLVDSPGWDFVRNVAREGFAGRGGMLERERGNAETLGNKVTTLAKGQLPSVATKLNPDKSTAGREAQDALLSNYTAATQDAKGLYKDFMGKFGGTPINEVVTDPVTGKSATTTTTLKQLHNQRSNALEMGRSAAAAGDEKSKFEAMKNVQNITDRMEAGAPDLMDEYKQLGDRYGKVMEQFDNPVVRSLRENTTQEQLVDMIVNPKKLNTFTPFRDISTVPGRNMPAHQSVSQEDAIHLIRQAVGEDKFKQLRADAIMALGQGSQQKLSVMGTSGLDGSSLVNKLKENEMSQGVKNALFGPGTAQSLDAIAQVTEHTQRARTGSGALWIVMRQPSEALKMAGKTAAITAGAAGLAGGAGYETGHTDLGLAAGGAILLSPLIFSKILRSPSATKLFTQAIGAQPSMKSQILQRLATQIPAEAVREQTPWGSDEGPMSATIPIPPTR